MRPLLPSALVFLPLLAPSHLNAQASEHLSPHHIVPGLEWRAIGPAIAGGRITDVEVVPGTQSHIYVGSASGGVWKTVNHGTTWEPIFDDAANLSVGDIALAPSDPLEIWVGTGEANNRNSSPWGEGIYHSSDGGKTWALRGLEQTRHIGRIVIHPTNPDVVWVGAVGHLFGPNEERGVFKTTDRGLTWERVLFIDENTGVVDLALDPSDPETLYAATYQRQRRAWGFIGGGPGSGIHKSTDGGATWSDLQTGLPQGDLGRIGLAVSARNPNLVMAIVEADSGGVFRSEDKGGTWTKVNDLNQRPMYYSTLRIDPNDDQRVYEVAGNLHRSTDGGSTFTALPMELEYNTGVHVDHHALWIDPQDSNHLILGNDGGLYTTWDMGANWTFIANIPIEQFYDIDLDMSDPYYVYGGLQDNNSYRGPSRTRRYQGILNRDWQVVDYGDGMYAETDWSDPGTVYVTSQNAGIIRLNVATGDRKALKPFPRDTADTYRFDWKSPILVSPHNSDKVYLGGNRLFTSEDQGVTWRETEDLTRELHQDSLPIMGMLADSTTLSKHDGTSGYGEITTISESPITPGVVWIGADDGTVQVSLDAGETWNNVTDRIDGIPFPYYVSSVEASHSDPARAYLSLDGHWDDDYAPYLYVTEDYGASWRSVAEALPSNTVNVVREHPTNPDLLFVGTENGVFASRDRGVSWGPIGSGLPAVPVDDLEIHPRDNDLVAGTHGRGIWILDDISPLAQASAVAVTSVQLVSPRPATLFLYRNDVPSVGQGTFRAENPSYGANVDYWLPEQVDGVELKIVNGAGDAVRTLEGTTAPGLNRVAWDLRHDPLPHDTARFDVPQLDAGPRGPLVLPAPYTVQLTVGGETRRAALDVRPDPDLPVPASERLARYEFTMALYALQQLGYEQGVTAYDLDKGRDDIVTALDSAGVEESEEVTEFLDRISEVADEWRSINSDVRNWWTGLIGKFDGGPSTIGSLTGPSDDQQRRLITVQERATTATADLEDVNSVVVPKLNELLEALGVQGIRPMTQN